MKRYSLLILLMVVGLGLLAACGEQTSSSTADTIVPGSAGEPAASATEPASEPTPAEAAPTGLVPIIVNGITVDVGIGSPIPVDVLVGGTWPSLCSQLAQVNMTLEGSQFDITLLADPGPADCPPDFVGLAFGMRIPINHGQLPEGTYTAVVNGMSTTFDIPVTPPAMEPGSGEGSGEQPPVAANGLCLDVPRPALALFIPGEDYLITDPISGASCYTTLDGDVPGLFQATADAVYYTVLDGDNFVIKRLAQDGTASLLDFTAVPRDDALLYHSFAVSADGSQIAWGASGAGPNYDQTPTSNMWLASTAGGDVVSPLPPLQPSGDESMLSRALVPVRFSDDNSTLYYTQQPVGLGGAWSSYFGRYDNLYALRLGTDAAPTLIFDCAAQDLFLCIGDFTETAGQVGTLAYVDGSAVVFLNGQGETLNTIAVEDEYVGFPTFGPGGELVFYGADLSDTSIWPDMGILYRVAPVTAPAEVLASSPGLMTPQGWLDGSHVAVAYNNGGENIGTAVVGLDGSLNVVQSEPTASFVTVLPAPGG